MRILSVAAAAALHAAILVGAGFVHVDLVQDSSAPWGDGQVDLALAARAETPVTVAELPRIRHDAPPASRPEFVELASWSGAAAEGDEDDWTLPEGGAPPPAPSIAVDGGPFGGRPAFKTFAKLGAPIGGRIGRGRRGATGAGDGVALHAAIAPPAPEAPPPALVLEPPPREPLRVAARVVTYEEPRYPLAARERQIEGVVRLEAEVLADGSVGDVRVIVSSGSRLLDEAAVAAVRRWSFAPATVDGAPVASVLALPAIRFRMQ